MMMMMMMKVWADQWWAGRSQLVRQRETQSWNDDDHGDHDDHDDDVDDPDDHDDDDVDDPGEDQNHFRRELLPQTLGWDWVYLL